MKTVSIWGSAALCCGLLLLASCGAKNPAKAATPVVGTPVAALPDATPAPTGDNPAYPEAEELTLHEERVVVPPLRPGEPIPQQPQVTEPQADKPTPAPARRPAARPSTPSAARNSGTETEPEPEPARVESRPPSLKPMLSDTERRQLLSQTDANLERARRNLSAVQANRLEQNELSALSEARSFVARAEQLRESDPLLANSLAERAAILSQEVLRKQR